MTSRVVSWKKGSNHLTRHELLNYHQEFKSMLGLGDETETLRNEHIVTSLAEAFATTIIENIMEGNKYGSTYVDVRLHAAWVEFHVSLS
jgi:hypothetical protein